MATVMKISPQCQIRIPEKLMKAFGIGKGDYVEVNASEEGIILKPRKLIDPAQSWYWSREWQQKEADADAEIKKEALSPEFQNADEGLKWLKE